MAKRGMLQKLGLNTTTVLNKYKVQNVKQKPYEGKDIEIDVWLTVHRNSVWIRKAN